MDQIWFAEKNVTLITTDLKGTDVADIYADFKFSEDGKEIISCPAGHRPKSNVYDINTQKCKASFPILESYGSSSMAFFASSMYQPSAFSELNRTASSASVATNISIAAEAAR